MGAGESALGLRDRKKIQTRDTIRRESMRLFEANGYANTTVEQIAEAAEIAPSTFFRYFPTKESVLMANELDKVMIEALAAQPADMSRRSRPFGARSRPRLPPSPRMIGRFERNRLRIVLSVPELKAAQLDEYHRTVARLAEAESRAHRPRPGRLRDHAFSSARWPVA